MDLVEHSLTRTSLGSGALSAKGTYFLCASMKSGTGVNTYHVREIGLEISMLDPLVAACFSDDLGCFCSSWQRCPISRLILVKKAKFPDLIDTGLS
jgi:hypothetical protein